jgi:adenine-specific DNA-methyltransferase
VSRLTDLIAQAKAKDPQMAADLEREFRALSSRLSFGLNFERHRPEAIELPQRPIRRGDKVRVLPERGSTRKGDPKLWRVVSINKARKSADLELLDAPEPEPQTVALGDLVVVAEFRDTIYPGLVSTGKVTRGGDKPSHTIINGENYHVLKALTWTHRGKVDAIYIDPPYNTGAKDWKYNNDYVEGEDLYRHSKWLAMMERRLLIARGLLNPANSALIVTIDEKEFLRLGLLLEQVFPEAKIQMVSSVINPTGTQRRDSFNRTDEYLYFVRLGEQQIYPEIDEDSEGDALDWQTFRLRNASLVRSSRPNQFYAVYVRKVDGVVVGCSDPLTLGVKKTTVKAPAGCEAVFPIRSDGTEMLWAAVPGEFLRRLSGGYIRAGKPTPKEPQTYIIQYLRGGTIADIESGEIEVTGKAPDGSVVGYRVDASRKLPTTQWNRSSHNAQVGGTGILKALMPDRRFPFPKSLYAVEDALRFVVAGKPEAVVLDFFSGSGTTAHAVMRLNRQDGGRRQCISVTNNEVASDEQAALRERNSRPGDPDWESLGICDYITKPRVEVAITGKKPDGESIEGDYKYSDEFPMAEGFEENAEFFTLTYETPIAVSHHIAFARIAPLLWFRAGCRGRRIEKLPTSGWEVVDAYGLLTELDSATEFLKAVGKAKRLRVAYIVTDDERRFQALARRLPHDVEAIRLYESYLTNFSFSNGD